MKALILLSLVLLIGCKAKEPVIKEVYKTEFKTDTLYKEVKIKVPVDCNKIDTVIVNIGEIKGSIVTGQGKATAKLNGKFKTIVVTRKVTEYKVMKPDVIKIYPLWWIWVILFVSLVGNCLILIKKFTGLFS